MMKNKCVHFGENGMNVMSKSGATDNEEGRVNI